MMNKRSILERLRPLMLVMLAFGLVTSVACGEDDSDKPEGNNPNADAGTKPDVEQEEAPFALIGIWGNTNNASEYITESMWGNDMKILEFNNEERWVITQNTSDHPSADKYNKIVWTPIVRQETYYCMLEIGRNKIEQAKDSTKKADDSDPAAGGCPEGSVRSWSFLTRM